MVRAKLSRRQLLQCGAVLAAGAATAACGRQTVAESPSSSLSAAPQATADPGRTLYRAMWVSYLDWAALDFGSADSFRAGTAALLDNCVSLGLNTVIAQVRPFGDALYASSLYPWSHLCTGVQGQDPGYDPLDILLEEAHGRGLSLEAWLNPYRLRLNDNMPPSALAADSLANTHPEWCVTVDGGVYLNPAIPQAADYVVQGVTELVTNYAVDGVHFDDYFYPTTEESIDAEQYAAANSSLALADWRRENVTRLVAAAHDAVKAADPTLRFGISPQGNPDNNYDQQYSDVNTWISPEDGQPLVDYICPQVYWGYNYTLSSGSDRFAFANICAEWLALPRAQSVSLVFGLGAYRIGGGDGGHNEDSTSQWQTGHNLADMVGDLTAWGADGYALYRYASLFGGGEYADLAAAECAALAQAAAQ